MAARKRTVTRRKPRTTAARRTTTASQQKSARRIAKFVVPLVFIIVITFGLGFMLLMGYRTAAASAFFNVKSVEITGLNRASKDEIDNIVRRNAEQTGVWNADLLILRRDIEALTFVKTATVSRVLPDGILVHLDERTPRAVIKTDLREVWVDDDAVVLSKFDKSKEALPFYLKGWDESKSINALGDNIERVMIYSEMLKEWQEFDLVKRVIEIDLTDLHDAKALVKDSGEMVEISLGKEAFGKRLRDSLKAIANKGSEIKSFDVQNSVAQPRGK